MKTWTKYNRETGEIIGWSSGDMEHPGEDYVESPLTGPGHPRTQYVEDGKVCDYTPEEQAAKDSMLPGWTWAVPHRKAMDLRTPEQQVADAAAAVSSARAAEYPPLANLADALYWQSQGDNSKMDAYLAACAAVKERFPKLEP